MDHEYHHQHQQQQQVRKPTLPPSVVGPVDVARLVREIEAINEAMLQLKVREGGSEVKLPKTSHLMELMTEHNKLNLLMEEDRSLLERFLKAVMEEAPVVHMSFSADPSQAFLEKISLWFRKEINPYTLITVGLQPNIGAGMVMRTTNKYFDMSLKESFVKKKDDLKNKLFPEELLSSLQAKATQNAAGHDVPAPPASPPAEIPVQGGAQ